MIVDSVTSIGASKDLTRSKQLEDLKKACEQFEAVFAKKLLGEMRKGVQTTQFGDAPGGEIYKDMMDQALADSMAKRGALGIGKMLYRQFEKQVGGVPVSQHIDSGPAAKPRAEEPQRHRNQIQISETGNDK